MQVIAAKVVARTAHLVTTTTAIVAVIAVQVETLVMFLIKIIKLNNDKKALLVFQVELLF